MSCPACGKCSITWYRTESGSKLIFLSPHLLSGAVGDPMILSFCVVSPSLQLGSCSPSTSGSRCGDAGGGRKGTAARLALPSGPGPCRTCTHGPRCSGVTSQGVQSTQGSAGSRAFLKSHQTPPLSLAFSCRRGCSWFPVPWWAGFQEPQGLELWVKLRLLSEQMYL